MLQFMKKGNIMKKMMQRGSIVVLMTLSSIYGADTGTEAKKNDDFTLKTRSGFDLGLQAYGYSYVEEVDGDFFMSNKGRKYGLSAGAVKTFDDEYYIKGEARYATGNVRYSSDSGSASVSDDVYEVRITAGSEAYVNTYLLSSYIGVGYRLLNNDLRDFGVGGYRRTSQYLYIPIGVTHRFWFDKSSRISTSIEYDYFVKGEQKSYLSDVSPAYAALFGDQVNKQKKGYGARISSTFEQNKWSAGLFLNYWDIEDSEINFYEVYPYIIGFMEPKNKTTEIGLEIKYHF